MTGSRLAIEKVGVEEVLAFVVVADTTEVASAGKTWEVTTMPSAIVPSRMVFACFMMCSFAVKSLH
jgi:hypothetical protein